MPVSLWDFALEKYRHPMVADVCIQLQDNHGASVCELLYAAWLADQDQQVDAPALSDFRKLRRGLYLSVQRLRGARRLLELDPFSRSLGRQVRPLEIEAEKLLLLGLQDLAGVPKSQDPFVVLHQVDAPFGLGPDPIAQKLYTRLQELLAQA